MKTLQWTDKTKNWLVNNFVQFKDSGDCGVHHGCCCVFVPISKKVGAKIYCDKYNRNFSHRKQKEASEIRIGPRTGDKFELNLLNIAFDEYGYVDDVDNVKVFGYLTEIASPAIKIKLGEKSRLFKSAESIGLKTRDLDSRNLGRINGRLVVIDFDPNSHDDDE